jgi:hypothetical protein
MCITSFARRWSWHLRALGFNPLVRATDRLESLVVLAALSIALFAVPVAAQAGAITYHSDMRAVGEQALGRHPVTATALEGASLTADFGGPSYVRAQWREGARSRTEKVITPTTVNTGEQFTVWLDDTGKVVAAPLTPEDAKASATVAAGAIGVIIAACSALVAHAIRIGLDRSRHRAWDRELALLTHNDDGWANRHT